MDLEKIRKTAYERLKTKASNEWDEIGSKYYHGQRVGRLALSLRKFTLPDDDSFDEILTAAAWLHDIQHGRKTTQSWARRKQTDCWRVSVRMMNANESARSSKHTTTAGLIEVNLTI